MNTDVKQELEKRWERMRSAKDQLRVEMNLAKQEAKKRWKRFGFFVEDAQKFAADVGRVSKRAWGEITTKFTEFRNAPRREPSPPTAEPGAPTGSASRK